MRYKLSQNGLEWDNYVYTIPNGSQDTDLRSEMELIKLSNDNYRIAIPRLNPTGNHKGIVKIDISGTNGTVVSGSSQVISLTNTSGIDADPYGIEFDPTGRYIYITHRSISGFSNALDVYDLNTSSFVSLPTLSGISNFRKSYIERYGDKMYLASDSYIGQLGNLSNPTSLSFNSTFLSINSGYGNALGGGPTDYNWRYLLPDQVDMPYANLADLSCDCCKKWHADVQKYTATGTATWSPGNNPFGSVDGTVYIRDELRIKAGAHITVNNMKFYFGEDAVAVVERKDGSTPPAYLRLTNGSVFTADLSCSAEPIVSCDDSEECAKNPWSGVRVQGYDSDHSQSTSQQAQFYMDGNSMIEYAEIGILAGDETQSNYGGGIVSIIDSRLKDNETGISFDPYSRSSGSTELYNRSYLYRNTFSTTNGWIFPGVPKVFVEVHESSGLNVQGNTFENTNTVSGFSDFQKGYGIKTVNSRVNASWACSDLPNPCLSPIYGPVYRNKFTNLCYGICGQNSGQNVRTLTCNYGLFEKNLYGIYLSNFIEPTILDNIFEMPSGTYNAIGLYMLGSTGYNVQNNDFSTYDRGSTSGTYGICILNSGAGANEIYRNKFKKLMIGGYAKGVNTDINNPPDGYADGLRWFCNTFDKPISTADIALHGSMSDEQGNCSRPANNLFSQSNTLYPSHKGLLAYSGSLQHIDYKYSSNNIGTYPRLKPDHYSGEYGSPYYYQLGTCPSSFNPATSCPVDLSGAPIFPEIEVDFANNGANELMSYATLSEKVADYANQIAAIENQDQSEDAESGLAQLKYEYNKLWHSAVRQYQNDTTGIISKDQMQALLNQFKPKEVSRFASVILPQSERSWIDQNDLSATTAYSGGPLPAKIDGKLPLKIPEWFESDFFASASNASALNALYISEGAIYEPYIPEIATIGNGWSGNLLGNSGSTNNSQLIVQPNPFNESVHFNLTNFQIEGSQNRLEFYDITGVQLYSVPLSENQTQMDIDGSNLPAGVILYTLYIQNAPVENGKIVRVE